MHLDFAVLKLISGLEFMTSKTHTIKSNRMYKKKNVILKIFSKWDRDEMYPSP